MGRDSQQSQTRGSLLNNTATINIAAILGGALALFVALLSGLPLLPLLFRGDIWAAGLTDGDCFRIMAGRRATRQPENVMAALSKETDQW